MENKLKKRIIMLVCSAICACSLFLTTAFAQDQEPSNLYFEDDFDGFTAGTELTVSPLYPAYTSFTNASVKSIDEARGNVLNVCASSGNNGGFSITAPSLSKEWQLDFKYDAAWVEYSGLYFTLYNSASGDEVVRFAILPTVGWAQLQTVIPGQSMQWTAGFAAQKSEWYTVKLRLYENTAYIKLWQAGTDEPQNWGYSLAGSTLTENSADVLTLTAVNEGGVVNTCIDNMTVKTWDERKAPVYDDGSPKYTYFEDDFSKFTSGALTVDREKYPVYTEFTNASAVKYSDEITSTLKIDGINGSNGTVTIACPALEKDVYFDYLYNPNYNAYNGMYIMLHREADGSETRFAFLPTAGNPNNWFQIVAPGEELGWSSFDSMTNNVWYSIRLRLYQNKAYIKLWQKGTDEPSEWNYTKTFARTLTENGDDYISIMINQDGTTVSTYIDNLKISTWEEYKVPIITDDPKYTYYTDDFASYDEGTLEKSETKAIVSELVRASISGDKTLLLSSDNQGHNSHITIALPKAEKRIAFDFKTSRASSAWGRMSVSVHKDAGGGSYSYSVFPGATWGQGKHLQMLADGTEQWLDGVATGVDTWYSCTIQLRKNVMSVKVWEKSATEPDAWTYSYTIPTAVTENDTDSITITNYEQDGGYNDLYLDNLTVMTWEEVAVNAVKVNAPASDGEMGTVTGAAEYLAGTTVTLEATAKRGYRFDGWQVNGETLSTEEVYSFTATADITVTALFSKAVLEIKSLTAVGQTLETVIDKESKTATVRLASDVDLSAVNMFFYTDPDIEIEGTNYVLDLSNGSASVGEWTVIAEKNTLMTTFYVDSEKGSDGNDGLSADKAFKSIEKAICAASEIEEWTGDVLVILSEGVHSPKSTLTFDASNGAKKGYALIFDGKNSEKTVISGGVRITEWTESDVFEGAYEAKIPALPEGVDYVRDLYVDGVRATLARSTPLTPTNWDACDDSEFEKITDGYIATGSKSEMHTWKNQSDIELVYEQGWKYHVVPIVSIEKATDGSIVNYKKEVFDLASTGLILNDPNYIQNAIELLDEPGECYYDRTANKIYYIPLESTDISESVIVMPVLEKLVSVRGDKNNQVYGVQFKNISFKYTSFLEIHDGHADQQSNFRTTGGHSSAKPTDKTPNSLTFDYVTGARIESCSFEAMATGAIDYGIGMRASSIYASSFKELGATAIQIGGEHIEDAQPMSKYTRDENLEIVEGHEPEPERITNGILVLSNSITRVAQQLKGGVGIWMGFVSDTTISHNLITELPYSGMCIGWGWGVYDKAPDVGQSVIEWDTPSSLYRIVVENNDIHDVMQYLYDGGCIYTLSYMPGSVISGNLVYNSRHFGIYNDQGSGGFAEMAENIMYKCGYGAYYYHNINSLYTARMKATEKSMYNNYFEWEASEDEHYNFVRNRAGTLDTAVMGKFAPASLVSEAAKEYTPEISDTTVRLSENGPVIKTADKDGYDFDGRAKLTLSDTDGNVVLTAYENNDGTIANGFINLRAGKYTVTVEKQGMLTYTSKATEVSDGDSIVIGDFAPIYGDIRGSFESTSGDGIVDIDDFIRVLRGFSSNANEILKTSVDINSDGNVNVEDIAIIKANYGKKTDSYDVE